MDKSIDIIDEKKKKRDEILKTPIDSKGKKKIHAILSGQKGIEKKIKNKVGKTLNKTASTIDKIYRNIL
jgi:hypothetical protein